MSRRIATKRAAVIARGVVKDAYDEIMSCVGAFVECGDDVARSAMRLRRKLASRARAA